MNKMKNVKLGDLVLDSRSKERHIGTVIDIRMRAVLDTWQPFEYADTGRTIYIMWTTGNCHYFTENIVLETFEII